MERVQLFLEQRIGTIMHRAAANRLNNKTEGISYVL